MAVTPEIRKLNKRNTYLYIYRHKECSKQELASSVGQSLPTVNQNLNELLEDGFVRVAGHYKSTGGRKPGQGWISATNSGSSAWRRSMIRW